MIERHQFFLADFDTTFFDTIKPVTIVGQCLVLLIAADCKLIDLLSGIDVVSGSMQWCEGS